MKSSRLNIVKIVNNNFHMIGAVCRADAGYFIFSLLVRMLSGICTSFLYVYLLGMVLYCIENEKSISYILLFLTLSMVFFATAFALQAYYDHIFKPVHRERVVNRLQQGLFDKLHNSDMENYDIAQMYTIVALANDEIATRPLNAMDNLFRGVECLISIGTIIIGIIPANGFVFGICIVSFVVGIFITNVQSKKVVQYDEDMRIKDKKISLLRCLLYLPEYSKDNRLSRVHDIFLKDYNVTVKEKERIAARSGKQIANLSFLQKMFCNAFCIDFLIPFYLSVVVLLFGKLSISEFVIAINAGAQIQQKLEALTDIISDFLKNGRFAERIQNIDKIQCNIEAAVGGPVDSMQTLSVKGATFFYPDGTLGLSDVNLTIHKGSKIAIVGSNGSGKSTLIKLLLRFYDAASGEILQNGIDIRTYDISSYRSQFSVAFQDFNIYATSIRNNVCMGDDMDEDRLLDALNKAGLSDSIKDLNAQLTREFDENGILFSGGLLQRLALARVFYKDSDIVIMDEPTAAMDVFFEKQFYDTIFKNLKEKTVIFISHRLSSITACDKIIFMDHGKILEEGTHEYLMNLQGGYYRLFCAQFES